MSEPSYPSSTPPGRENPSAPHRPGEPYKEGEPSQGKPRVWGCLFLVAIMIVAGIFGARYVASSGQTKDKGKDKEKRAVPVTTAKVEQKEVPVEVHVVGSVTPYSTIPVTSQVTGTLTKVLIHQGDFVYEGQPLFVIDSRTQVAGFQQANAIVSKDQATVSQAAATGSRDVAAVSQARANLAKDQSLVDQAKSALARDLAQLPYLRKEQKRYQQLLAQGYVTQESADQASTNVTAIDGTLAADRAAIQSAEATVRADRAAIDSALATVQADQATVRSLQSTVDADRAAAASAGVQVGFTAIRSPIKGRTGTLNIYEGTLVQANSTSPLITIDEITPIRVSFAVPEKYLAEIRRGQQRTPLAVEAASPDAKGTPERGVVNFIENTVDTTTGTIILRADFPNLTRRLWPGEFVTVNLLLRRVPNAVVVPSHAVQPGQSGDYVFVVKEDKTVEVRPVTVDFTYGDSSIIKSGLKPGETVVTDGQLQLTPGASIQEGGRGGKKKGGGSGLPTDPSSADTPTPTPTQSPGDASGLMIKGTEGPRKHPHRGGTGGSGGGGTASNMPGGGSQANPGTTLQTTGGTGSPVQAGAGNNQNSPIQGAANIPAGGTGAVPNQAGGATAGGAVSAIPQPASGGGTTGGTAPVPPATTTTGGAAGGTTGGSTGGATGGGGK